MMCNCRWCKQNMKIMGELSIAVFLSCLLTIAWFM